MKIVLLLGVPILINDFFLFTQCNGAFQSLMISQRVHGSMATNMQSLHTLHVRFKIGTITVSVFPGEKGVGQSGVRYPTLFDTDCDYMHRG